MDDITLDGSLLGDANAGAMLRECVCDILAEGFCDVQFSVWRDGKMFIVKVSKPE